MNRQPSRWIVAAAASLPLLLTGCSDDSPGQPVSGVITEPAGEPDYVLLLDDDSDPDQMEGEPGRYAFTARSAESPPLAVLEVPAGFSNFGYFALWPYGSGDESDEEPFRAIQYWSVYGVYPDPCDRKGEAAAEIGGSVEALAEALAEQKLTSTSEPVPVTLDGHEGLYVETTVPSDVRVDDCDDGYYMRWDGSPGDRQHTVERAGTVERTWILDVAGERVVLVAITAPGVTEAQADELVAMVESVRFVEPQ